MAKRDKLGSVRFPTTTSNEEIHHRGAVLLRGRSPVYRMVYRGVALFMVVAVIFGVVSIIGQSNRLNRLTDQNAEQMEATYNPSFRVRYQALGEQIISSWFSGESQLTPVANGIVWPSNVEEKSQPVIDQITLIEGNRNETVFDRNGVTESADETLTYLVNYNGSLYKSSILLRYDSETETPILLSEPTLEPYTLDQTAAEDQSSEPEHLDAVDGEPSDSMVDQLNTWAAAWASNDGVALKQSAQDDDPENNYFGLGGWTLEGEPSILWRRAYTLEGTEYVFMQVKFQITSVGSSEDLEEGEEPPVYRNTQYMDIMVEDYESGLPAIIAWGPAGSWSILDRYHNAVTEDVVLSDELSEESPSPSAPASEAPSDAPAEESTTEEAETSGEG